MCLDSCIPAMFLRIWIFILDSVADPFHFDRDPDPDLKFR